MEFILFLSLFGFNGCNASSDSGGQPKQINLVANGWMITIKPDGSAGIGRLKESNAIFSTASSASGAVDFEKLKTALNASFARSESTEIKTYFQANIIIEGQESMGLKPVNNIKIWNQLIVQLEPKWTGPMLSAFKKAVEKNPLTITLPQ